MKTLSKEQVLILHARLIEATGGSLQIKKLHKSSESFNIYKLTY